MPSSTERKPKIGKSIERMQNIMLPRFNLGKYFWLVITGACEVMGVYTQLEINNTQEILQIRSGKDIHI